MTEYKIGNATVRIHGTANQEKIRDVTVEFLKAVEAKKRKTKKEKQTVEKGA